MVFSISAFAAKKSQCAKVEKACSEAGYFVGGGVNPNSELWADCVNPIMDGKASTVKNLKLSDSTINKCKKENPNFGRKG